jgi:hypothetical protein
VIKSYIGMKNLFRIAATIQKKLAQQKNLPSKDDNNRKIFGENFNKYITSKDPKEMKQIAIRLEELAPQLPDYAKGAALAISALAYFHAWWMSTDRTKAIKLANQADTIGINNVDFKDLGFKADLIGGSIKNLLIGLNKLTKGKGV